MSKKLTDWFPPQVKPVHIGIYNASTSRDSGSFRYWNGVHWSLDHMSPQHALSCMGTSTAFEHEIHWRGLAEKP